MSTANRSKSPLLKVWDVKSSRLIFLLPDSSVAACLAWPSSYERDTVPTKPPNLPMSTLFIAHCILQFVSLSPKQSEMCMAEQPSSLRKEFCRRTAMMRSCIQGKREDIAQWSHFFRSVLNKGNVYCRETAFSLAIVLSTSASRGTCCVLHHISI